MADSIEAHLQAICDDLGALRKAFEKHSVEDMEIFEQVNAGLARLNDWAASEAEERRMRQARQDERDKVMIELAERETEAAEAAAKAEEARRKAVVFYGRMSVICIGGVSAAGGALSVLGVI